MRHQLLKLLVALRVHLVHEGLDLGLALDRGLEDILLKKSSPARPIRENHDPDAFLDALVPRSHVGAPVCPSHHTIALPLIINVAPHINVARLPLESAVPMLLIVDILSLVSIASGIAILVCLLLFPLTVAVLHATFELTSIATSVYPLILTEALWFTVDILTNKDISIGEEVTSVSVAQGTKPFTLIFVTISPNMDTIALSLGILPLTNVAFPIQTFPYSISTLHSLQPLTVINLPILPRVNAFASRLATLVSALISIAI